MSEETIEITKQYFVDNNVLICEEMDCDEWIETNGKHNEGALYEAIRKELDDNAHLYGYDEVESTSYGGKERVRLNSYDEIIASLERDIASYSRMSQSWLRSAAKAQSLLSQYKP